MSLFKISSKIYGAWSVDVENDFITVEKDKELLDDIRSSSEDGNGRTPQAAKVLEILKEEKK